MAKRTLPSPITGKPVEATLVEIKEISEKPTVISLADGAVLRLKLDVIEVARFENERDPEGNPIYNVRSGNILAVLEAPESLRKKTR
ncbi:MAG: hypothetical protein F4103_13870 [Boseongicola sp. SB0673_bin_14]|nr:hypothetical protein [Boseongicola sp. SB0673_bin_14]